MGELRVKRAAMAGGKIERVVVEIDRVPDRTIDRDTLVRWMRDGHSAIPVVNGVRLPALLLVEVGEPMADSVRFDTFAIRTDPEPVDEDRLPALPAL